MMRMRFGHSGPARILVVDDEPLIAHSTGAILSGHGYEVLTALSGEEAVAEAASFGPDLLISDISMLGMNGLETAALIAGMFPGCRVLFRSGCSVLAEIVRSIPENLVYSFARKPMPVQDMLDCVTTMLSAVDGDEPIPSAYATDDSAPSLDNAWMLALSQSCLANSRAYYSTPGGNGKDARLVRLDLPGYDKPGVLIQ